MKLSVLCVKQTNKQKSLNKGWLKMDMRFFATASKESSILSPTPRTYMELFQGHVLGWWLRRGGDSWHETQRLGTSSQCSSLGTHRIIENWPFHLRPLLSVFAAPGPLLSPSGRPDHLAGRRDAVCRDKSWPMLPVNRAVACTLHLSLNLQSSSR